MKKRLFAGLIMITSLFFSVNSEASLIGDDVTIQRGFNTFILSSTTVTVGSGIELYSWNNWLFDISGYSIYMASLSNSGYISPEFNGFIFSSLDFGSPNEVISSVLVTGLDQSRVAFSDHALSLDFNGLGFSNSQSITVDISTTTVPVPGALLLLSSGLIGLVASGIKRK